MIMVASSISDPVHEVVDAMAEVERGRIGNMIDVYERSEIGQLQTGFNRMVAGLQERDHLRDLFGRHVGEEVVRRAVAENESLSGDERDVAVLFIDLVGSTQLTSTREPHEVAKVLNEFFQIVVAAVDARHGLINKFQGDAALAVFGAPLRIDNPGVGRAGVCGQHRCGKPLRVHRRRGRGQRGGTVGGPGQGVRQPGAVFSSCDRPRRRGGASVLGRAGLGDVARPGATHADLGTHGRRLIRDFGERRAKMLETCGSTGATSRCRAACFSH